MKLRNDYLITLVLMMLFLALTACSTPLAAPPTPVPPTDTPVPPTETPVPPTPTPEPTATPVPPTPTKIPSFSGLVDAGGYKLNIMCSGEGSPTVVLESGHTMSMWVWKAVMQKKPSNMGVRVCRYDRSGLGSMGKVLSERAPNKPRTNLDMANDLYRLLTNANIDGPFIMVGHSMGAWIIRLFADQHPEDVVGMVLVDGGHPDSVDSIFNLIPPETEDECKKLTAFRDYYTRLMEDPLLTEEYWYVITSAEQLRAVDPLGDIPLVVLSRDTNNRESQYELLSSDYYKQYGGEFPVDLFNQIEDDWVVKIEELAELSTNSNLIIVEGSSNLLPYRQSEAVITAIQWVLEQVRE